MFLHLSFIFSSLSFSQEDYNRLLTKYAEAENTIDRLRLEAKVGFTDCVYGFMLCFPSSEDWREFSAIRSLVSAGLSSFLRVLWCRRELFLDSSGWVNTQNLFCDRHNHSPQFSCHHRIQAQAHFKLRALSDCDVFPPMKGQQKGLTSDDKPF